MGRSKKALKPVMAIELFDTALGWMAILGGERGLRRLTFGHASPRSACLAANLDAPPDDVDVRRWHPWLAKRLQAFSAGQPTALDDLQLDLGDVTLFQRAVMEACREIPWGTVVTYGQLATRAGAPRAARAVGHVMATNSVPLVVPCHRVVAAGGRLGGYSAPQGTAMKRRLLDLEAAGRVLCPS